MIKIKHVMDTVEPDDGRRLWVEPIGLTKDMQEWCRVDHVLTHIGPPRDLWQWFQNHTGSWDFFRSKYHQSLGEGPYMEALRDLASAAGREDFTLLHQGDDPERNTAVAMYEFICELQAYLKPE